MMKPLLYISGPYSAPTLAERQINISIARRRYVAAWNSREWWAVCPHTMTSGMEMHCPDTDAVEWLLSDLSLLAACDALWACMPASSLHYSDGVALEIAWARRAGMPVFTAFETPGSEHLPRPKHTANPVGKLPQIHPYNRLHPQARQGLPASQQIQLQTAEFAIIRYVNEGLCIDPALYKGSCLRRKTLKVRLTRTVKYCGAVIACAGSVRDARASADGRMSIETECGSIAIYPGEYELLTDLETEEA